MNANAIVGFVDDVFFQAKIQEIFNQLKKKITFLRDEVPEMATLIIVDLAPEKNMEIVEQHADKCICFSEHKRGDLFQQAKAFGCERVYARSVFFQKLPELIA